MPPRHASGDLPPSASYLFINQEGLSTQLGCHLISLASCPFTSLLSIGHLGWEWSTPSQTTGQPACVPTNLEEA